MVSGGSGSPGTTLLTNPSLAGPIINWATAWPDAFEAEIARMGHGFLSEAADSVERNRFVIEVLRDVLIPRHHPSVVTLWLTEPDHAQHNHGLLSTQAREMLLHVDAEIEALVAHLCTTQDEPLTVFYLSDHGFETVSPPLPLVSELVASGLKAAPDSTDVVLTSNSLYLADEAQTPQMCAWLLARAWIDAVFVRDDLLAACPGALPQSAVGGGHRRSAPIMYSPRWSHDRNEAGVPGMVSGGPGLVATHGSTSPYALHNVMIGWGAGLKQSVVSEAPCGIVDIAPTVLHLLDIAPPACDGRVLHELLAEGPAPETLPNDCYELKSQQEGRRQVAHFGRVEDHVYLDQVKIVDDGP